MSDSTASENEFFPPRVSWWGWPWWRIFLDKAKFIESLILQVFVLHFPIFKNLHPANEMKTEICSVLSNGLIYKLRMMILIVGLIRKSGNSIFHWKWNLRKNLIDLNLNIVNQLTKIFDSKTPSILVIYYTHTYLYIYNIVVSFYISGSWNT